MKRLALACLLLASCYDSRWGQAKVAQLHAAQASTPAALHATRAGDDEPRVRVSRFRVRVVANARHAAQTMDWQRQARDLFEDVNRILEPSLGAHLEIESMRAWSATDDDLDAALAALALDEPAGESDWVVGLVGGLPRVTASFHEVGRARMLGMHVVLRAAPPMGEHDDIEKSLDELSEDERARFRKERKRHRAAAVFLHEIGHTLGAPHERDKTTLMNPFYDPKMASYSDDAAALMRISVDWRTRAHAGEKLDAHALAGALAERLRASPPSPEREEAIAQYDALAPSPAAASAAPPAPSPPAAPAVDLSGVAETDRPTYERAAALLGAAAAGMAWQTARPLFAKYPDVYAVQDLRCQLAIVRRLDAKGLQAECAAMKRLSSAQ